MNRRLFLSSCGLAALAGVLDPERLFWEPGKKVYFDLWTPPKAVMNTFVTPEYVMRTVAQRLRNVWDRGTPSVFNPGMFSLGRPEHAERHLSSGGIRAVAGVTWTYEA